MKHFSYHSTRLQAASGPLERRTGRRGQSKLPLLVVLALPSNKTDLYHVNGPTKVSIILFEKGLINTESKGFDFERPKGDCITQ